MSPAALGKARVQMQFQEDEESSVWGGISFAELMAYQGENNEEVGERIGYRAPTLKGLNAAPGSGVWIAVAARDAEVTVPGASQRYRGAIVVGRDDSEVMFPNVKKNNPALLRVPSWKFG